MSNETLKHYGAKEAANLLADTRGLTHYKTISLAFDAASKTWQ